MRGLINIVLCIIFVLFISYQCTKLISESKVDGKEAISPTEIQPSTNTKEEKKSKFEANLWITVTHSSYTFDGFSAKWAVTVKNCSNSYYKDINIKVQYYGESGTLIYESVMGHTEYKIIQPDKSLTIHFDDIMCPKQAVRARAFVSEGIEM